jgi:phage tail-like protein
MLAEPTADAMNQERFVLLNAHVGWRIGTQQHLALRTTLQLARARATARKLDEPGGGLGGLVLPANLTCDADQLYLLDLIEGSLKRFDACLCQFKPVPCLGGIGGGARQLLKPKAITTARHHLYVCDAGQGNARGSIKVFTLPEFALRQIWQPPKTLAPQWHPTSLARDHAGHVYVGDLEGSIYRLWLSGRWERFATGIGAITQLAFDAHGCLHALVGSVLYGFKSDGSIFTPAQEPETLLPDFPTLSIHVEPDGVLDLTDLCESSPGPVRFNLRGERLPDQAIKTRGPVIYERSGSFTSQPLDSELYGCQWHRVLLYGNMPSGSVEVQTYSAETEETPTFIAALPPEVWLTRQTTRTLDHNGWDCLVRSEPGRYLWLRLILTGDGYSTPALESVIIEYPRNSLRRFLPAVYGEEPVSANFTDRFLSIFDTTFQSLTRQIDQQARLFDPMATPAGTHGQPDFLTWLAGWIGVSIDRQMPEAKRRRFVAEAAKMYCLQGTPEGLHRQLMLFLGLDQAICSPSKPCPVLPNNCQPEPPAPKWTPPPLILEHFRLRRWLFLGAGRLGAQAELWGKAIVARSQLGENAQLDRTKLVASQDPWRDPFHVYAHKFTVFVPARLARSAAEQRSLRNLIRQAAPAHTQAHLEFVEPRFRIGVQATIGLNSVIGQYPQGVTLGGNVLGQDTVLPARPQDGSYVIGTDTRLKARETTNSRMRGQA